MQKQRYILVLMLLLAGTCYSQQKLYRRVAYHSNGKKQAEFYTRDSLDVYKGDKPDESLDSLYTEWAPEGKKIKQGMSCKGRETGKWTSWGISRSYYDYRETWYTNGSEDSSYIFEAWPGHRHKKRAEYFHNLKTNRMNVLQWYPNGVLKEESIEGEQVNISRMWDKQGEMLDETFYNHDSSVWRSRSRILSWHPNGRLKEEDFF